MTKKRYIAVAAALVLTGLGLAACTTATTPPAAPATTTPAPTPAEQLTAALGKLKGIGYDMAMVTSGGDISGKASTDPGKQAASLEQKGVVEGENLTLTAVEIGTSTWVKVDLGATGALLGLDPKKWMMVDRTKLTKTTSALFDMTGPDTFGMTGLLTKTNDVKATDATHLTGTVDLTAATGVAAPDKSDLTKAGDKAKAVPFTVTLDSQGRIAELNITADASVKELSGKFTFSNYGSPAAITAPPASDVVTAAPILYEFLNA